MSETPNNQPFRAPSQPDDRRNYDASSILGQMQKALATGWNYTITYKTTAIENYTPWHIELNPFFNVTAQTNWATRTQSTTAFFGGTRDSTGAVNASFSYNNFVTGAGTYQISIMHTTNADRGIYSVQIDTVQVGTIDGYSAAKVENVVGTISGIGPLSVSAFHTLAFVMTAKNGASTNFTGSIQWITIQRTA